MRRMFQNVAVFYGSLVLVALFFQWWVSASYVPELLAADQEAERPVNQIREHYGNPNGVPSEVLTLDLGQLHNKLVEAYKKIQEKVAFKMNPGYQIDSKSAYPAFDFQDRVKKFRANNEKKIKEVGNRLSATFLSGSILDPSVEKMNLLMQQASILEELLQRLDTAGVISVVESIACNIPREEAEAVAFKQVKGTTRFPILMELSADPATLDVFFAALHGGTNGYFFVEDLELSHASDPQLWEGRVKCKLTLSALSLKVGEYVEATPMTPAWAAGIGR